MVEMATRDAYGKALAELGERDKNICVLTADLAESTRTAKFEAKFPERHFDIGIEEANIIGIAAGLASCGKITFASTFAVFAPGRCYDQIRIAVAYSNKDVKIVSTHGGITVGEDGASHQACEDIALMRVLPNMRVVVPADAIETEKVIKEIAYIPGPFYVRLGRPRVPVIFSETYDFELGKGKVLRKGKDVAIIACGIMVSKAIEASDILHKRGVEATVVNMSTIKPLDVNLLNDLGGVVKGFVTAEEHSIYGGLGEAVAGVISENICKPVKRVGMMDVFGESGTAQELLIKYGLTADNIVKKALEIVV